MNGVNYFELLRLTLPEIVVALAALLDAHSRYPSTASEYQ